MPSNLLKYLEQNLEYAVNNKRNGKILPICTYSNTTGIFKQITIEQLQQLSDTLRPQRTCCFFQKHKSLIALIDQYIKHEILNDKLPFKKPSIVDNVSFKVPDMVLQDVEKRQAESMANPTITTTKNPKPSKLKYVKKKDNHWVKG